MARLLSQTLIRGSEALIRAPSAAATPASLVGLRRRSSLSDRVELIEVEVGAEAEAEAEAEAGEVEVFGMRRLEDAIHAIVVRRSAPDWLPFVPGASYWVPPRRRPSGIVELVSRLANPMTEEESLSFTTVRGWPSSAYFVEGRPLHPVKRRSKKASAQTDDEES